MFGIGQKKLSKPVKENAEKFDQPKIMGYLNPLWRVAVYEDGQKVIEKPFSHFIHTYLKDYGFEPDQKTAKTPVIQLEIQPGAVVKIPLFIKAMPKEGENVTPERARELGMIIQK